MVFFVNVTRILYGAPESEQEEENGLVAKLRKRHEVEYLNDFLGFAWELSSCKYPRLLPQKYDLVIYDTKLYGENWLPDIRAEHFKLTITPYFSKKDTPIIVLADEQIKDDLKDWIEKHTFHYVAQPYSIDEIVTKVNSLLPKARGRK